MDHSVNLSQLQQVVSTYVNQYQLLAAAGPIAAASLGRLIWGKNRFLRGAVKASAIWFAVKELSGPLSGVVTEQFLYLQNVFAMFRS